MDVASVGLLDLAHGRTTAADATTSGTTLACHGGENESGNECSPAKPEECSRGLGLAAVLLKTRGAVGNTVVKGVVL